MAKKKAKKKQPKKAKKAVKKRVKKGAAKARPKSQKKSPPQKAPKKKAAVKAAGKKPPAVKKKKSPSKPAPEVVLPWRQPLKGETLVGVVDDYYSHISVITLTLQAPLRVGDRIHVRGHTTDILQPVMSLQNEHQPVQEGQPGMGVGIQIGDKARRGDYIYKVE